MQLQQQSKLQQAQQIYQQIYQQIQQRPNYADSHLARGVTLRSLQRHEDANLSCNQAVQFRQDHAQAYFKRAIAHYRHGPFQQAVTSFETAILHQPDCVSAFFCPGNSLRQMKQDSAALPILLHKERGMVVYNDYTQSET